MKKHWAFLNVVEEMKSVVLLFRRKIYEGNTDASNRVQSAKRYISFLKELKQEDVVKQGIKSRFKEVAECQKVIEKDSTRSMALNVLEKVAASLEQFEVE